MIEVRGLTKKYGGHTAISDLNFSIEKGKIYGFLGPNGAGKSTTMNIIAGCLTATDGQILINGLDTFEHPEETRRLIGYLPEQPPLYMDMTVKEYLTFVAKAKGVSKYELQYKINAIVKDTRIDDVADRLIRNLSKGYKQRVGIAQALIGSPEIVILDEPTVGLDPKQIIEMRDLIKQLGTTHTVILSSHILSEVRAVCDSIMIISKGKLVASDTPENLEKLFIGQRSATIEVQIKADEQEVMDALKNIKEITGISYNKIQDSDVAEILISFDDQRDISEDVAVAFLEIKKPVLKMNTIKASLEEVFIGLTDDKQAEIESNDGNKEEQTDQEIWEIAIDGTEGKSKEIQEEKPAEELSQKLHDTAEEPKEKLDDKPEGEEPKEKNSDKAEKKQAEKQSQEQKPKPQNNQHQKKSNNQKSKKNKKKSGGKQNNLPKNGKGE